MLNPRSLVLLLALSAASSAAADELAILPFGGPEARRPAVRDLEKQSRDKVPYYFRKDVQGSQLTWDHAHAADAILECDRTETGCLKSFADLANVRQLLTGVLSPDGEVLTFRWYNFRPKKPLVRSMAVRLNPDVDQRLHDVDALSACLFADQCGELTLIKLEPPYRVLVDGVPTPGRTLRIPAGRHQVRIEKAGYLPLVFTKTVAMGDKTSFEPVLVALNPEAQAAPTQPEKKPEGLWMPEG